MYSIETVLPDAGVLDCKTTSLVVVSKVQSVCAIPSTVTVMLLSIAVYSRANRDWEILEFAKSWSDIGLVQSEQILRNVPPVI